MSFVNANGERLHVVTLGERDEKPPVVMVHGLLLGNAASWYFTCAPAIARTRHVVLYDLRGHGKSSQARTGYDVHTMADDLAALLAEYPGSVSLVGHSYGALIALDFALRGLRKVDKLALIDAPMPPSSVTEMSAFLGKSPDKMVDSLPDPVRSALASGKRAAAAFVARLAFLATETTLLADLRAEKDVGDAALAAMDVDTLCVYGSRSSCLATGHRLERVLPHARLVVLEGGHFLHLDARNELAAVLTEHLDG